MRGDRTDFFISHAGADRAWAEWVAWQLTDAGYSVELGVWDWAAGTNFVTAMSDALDRAAKVIALFSAAYFERERYTTQEWAATQVHAEQNRLVPVRVEKVPDEKVPPVLRPLIYCDVFGVPEDVARKKLLKAARGPRRPDQPPDFPGRSGSRPEAGPRRPGTRPRIWNVPVRNPAFTGRDQMLFSVRDALLSRPSSRSSTRIVSRVPTTWSGGSTPRNTLDRRRRVLGANDPDTRRSARNLARDRRALGEA